MSVNQYLEVLSKNLVLTADERRGIESSYIHMKGKLWELFQDKIDKVEVFGSFQRETILPKRVHQDADLDIMILFKEVELQPQTYLNQLRSFLEKNYPRSEVFQSFPTMVVSFEHTMVELVPAHTSSGFTKKIMIPAPKTAELKWISTDPFGFNQALISKDNSENNMILPLIRLLKYWNTTQNYPFESFVIENHAINSSDYWGCKSLKDYIFNSINKMKDNVGSDIQNEKIQTLQRLKKNLIVLENEGMNDYAILELQKLFPTINP